MRSIEYVHQFDGIENKRIRHFNSMTNNLISLETTKTNAIAYKS